MTQSSKSISIGENRKSIQYGHAPNVDYTSVQEASGIRICDLWVTLEAMIESTVVNDDYDKFVELSAGIAARISGFDIIFDQKSKGDFWRSREICAFLTWKIFGGIGQTTQSISLDRSQIFAVSGMKVGHGLMIAC